MKPLLDAAYRFLNFNWLRPDTVVWDTAAYNLISPELLKGDRIGEIGIGNGATTFNLLNGEFDQAYDMFFNVDIEGFWDNKDIYDVVQTSNIGEYIKKRPEKKLVIAVDHKDNLLAQARQLQLADTFTCLDANEPFEMGEVDLVFSNMLYWLKDLYKSLNYISDNLPVGGKIVTVFPNSNLFKFCPTFARNNRIMTLLNRGRADTYQWTKELGEFEKELAEKSPQLNIVKKQMYLCDTTMKFWDLGPRPLSPHFIQMANALSPDKRLEIKQDWVKTCEPFIEDLIEIELEEGPKAGAYNFVLLEKIS